MIVIKITYFFKERTSWLLVIAVIPKQRQNSALGQGLVCVPRPLPPDEVEKHPQASVAAAL